MHLVGILFQHIIVWRSATIFTRYPVPSSIGIFSIFVRANQALISFVGVLIPMFSSHLLPLSWRARHRKYSDNPSNRASCYSHPVLYFYTGRKNRRQLQWFTVYYYRILLSVAIDYYQLLLIIIEPGTHLFTKSHYILLLVYIRTVMLLQALWRIVSY